jgi:hypothetical protein
MAATYTILLEADASKQPNAERKTVPPKKVLQRVVTAAREVPGPKPEGGVGTNRNTKPIHSETETPHKQPPFSKGPDVNINLQIHISADASSDQIDQIFASMAKHLYKNG